MNAPGMQGCETLWFSSMTVTYAYLEEGAATEARVEEDVELLGVRHWKTGPVPRVFKEGRGLVASSDRDIGIGGFPLE
jgi:hypothetical protein